MYTHSPNTKKLSCKVMGFDLSLDEILYTWTHIQYANPFRALLYALR